MQIDKKSPVPVYFQLKNAILDKIKNGEYAPGNLIPSERELGEMLNISRMTVRQALNQLVSDGFLYREKGKGTFVAKGKIEQKNIMSFSETVRRNGLTPSTQILEFSRKAVTADIAAILDISEGELIYHVRRLRLADDKPIAIEEVFIPEKYCRGLERFDLKDSLYKLLREEYSYTFTYIDSITEAATPSKEEKGLLKIQPSTPVLRVSGTTHIENDIKLFHFRDSYRSDEYSYNVRIYTNQE